MVSGGNKPTLGIPMHLRNALLDFALSRLGASGVTMCIVPASSNDGGLEKYEVLIIDNMGSERCNFARLTVSSGGTIVESDVDVEHFVNRMAADMALISAPTANLATHAPGARSADFVERGAEILSKREFEVLRCVLCGWPNKVIARNLGIVESTVKVHIRRILSKTNTTNRTQLAMWATNQPPA